MNNSIAAPIKSGAASVLVPLTIEGVGPARMAQPLSLGVPFPKGAVYKPEELKLFGEEEEPVPVQLQPLARWSDGSVQWLLTDFLANRADDASARYTLSTAAPADARPSASPLRLIVAPDSYVVDTGAAVFHLDRGIFRPFTRVLVEGRNLLGAAASSCVLTDPKGSVRQPRIEHSRVEAPGPVRATIRLEGAWSGRVPLRFVARVSFYAGTGLVQLRLSVHNPRRARHRGGLWDLGDVGSLFFRDLSLALALPNAAPTRVHYAAEVGQPLEPAAAAELEIYQDSSGGANWQSRNHANRHGRVPCSFRGYRLHDGGREKVGLRASPRVHVQTPVGRIAAAVPEFWQQFPKAIEVREQCLRLRFFPEQFADLFELQGGERKTHTAWLDFGRPDPSNAADLAWVHQPAVARVESSWYAAAGVLPQMALEEESDCRLQNYLEECRTNLQAGREAIDEFGWRNYGDVHADHENTLFRGTRPVISHYNNQFDLLNGLLLQYVRGGDRAWLDLAEPLARHVMDIDIYHTNRDRAGYNGGLFWFTDHYRDAATSTHRTYSRHNRPADGRPYGGGPGNEHNYTTGLLHHYYLTGDPAAREAVLELADWVINMDDGRNNLLGLVDDGPTGLASCTGDFCYHGPGRGSGNSIAALLDAWLLTQKHAYLEKAEELIQRSIHPADEVQALDLLNAGWQWSYTMFLTVLARYLDLKAEGGQLDFHYAYARASLLHYAEWMLAHERSYCVDRTEVWAAQDFRKANVLRLAAGHADEPLRERLLRRGQELADRAWADLLRFESRATARAAAILLTEGVRDGFYRSRSDLPRSPAPALSPDFGAPVEFVPQRLRVRHQLKSGSGLCRAALRLLNPLRWRNWAARVPEE